MSGQCGTWPGLVVPTTPSWTVVGAVGRLRSTELGDPVMRGLWPHLALGVSLTVLWSWSTAHERPPRPVPARVWALPHGHLCSGLCAPRHSSPRPELWHQAVCRRPVWSAPDVHSPRWPTLLTAGPSLSESHSPSQVSLCSGRPRLDGGRRFPMN